MTSGVWLRRCYNKRLVNTATPRKPFVYLLVLLPILGGGGLLLIAGLIQAYSHVHGVPRSAVPDMNGLLISLPASLVWIPISLFLANLVLWFVPPLRRIEERHSARSGRPGFADSQKALLKALGFCALFCLPLIALGFVL